MEGVMSDSGGAKMTKADRENLLKIARLRERVTKSGLLEAGAQLLVDLDKQLEATYHFDQDQVWQESLAIATQAAKEAQAKVKERCRELGIPDRFAPSIYRPGWCSTGQQATKERRTELRQLARTQIDAMIKAGKRKVEEASLDVQTRIIASGLTEQAKEFLEAMPTPEQLMPRLSLGELEKMLGPRGQGYHQRSLPDAGGEP
jgi:hypothetical protein